MGVVVAVIFLAVAGGLLSRRWSGARNAVRQSRGLSPRKGRAAHRLEMAKMREKALIDDWLEERRHRRKNGDAGPVPDSGAMPSGGRGGHKWPWDAPDRRRRPARTVPGTVEPPGTRQPAPAVTPKPSASPGPHPARPAAGTAARITQPQDPATAGTQPAPSTATTGGTVTAASGAVEQLVEGVNGIRAEAMSGGIHAKHRAVKAAIEACERFSAMIGSLARELSEPGMNYGPEITEPLSRMSQFLAAGAATGSESDASLTTLKSMTVGDLASSARQAPDRAELSETGAR